MKRFDRPLVILVHGLWMTGIEMGLLARRLRREGFDTRTFSYVSVARDIPLQAQRLAKYLERFEAPEIHLVGHSMGGLVIECCLRKFKQPNVRRVVALGTPFRGAWAAKRMLQQWWMRPFLGKVGVSLATPLWEPWSCPQKLGIIAGELSFGAGKFLGRMPVPNDGTVSVEETRLSGANDHLTLRVTHYGLLFSPTSSAQTIYFLKNGMFLKNA